MNPPMAALRVVVCVAVGTDPAWLDALFERSPELVMVGRASSGGEALASMRLTDPDAVIVVGAIDGWDGVQFAHALRRERDTPVLLVLPRARVRDVRAEVDRRKLRRVAVLRCPTDRGDEVSERAVVSRLRWLVDLAATAEGEPSTTELPAVRVEPAACVDPSLRALADRSVDAVVIVGSAGTPHLLGRIFRGVADRGLRVPLIVAVHHNPSLSEGFSEWVGSMVSLPADPFDPRRGTLRYGTSLLQVVRAPAQGAADEHAPHLAPNLAEVLERLLAQRLSLLVLVGSGMQDEGLACLHRVRRSGGTVVVLEPSACAHPEMPTQVMQWGAYDAVAGPSELSWLITNAGSNDLEDLQPDRRRIAS